jgi:hypothetical protein
MIHRTSQTGIHALITLCADTTGKTPFRLSDGLDFVEAELYLLETLDSLMGL